MTTGNATLKRSTFDIRWVLAALAALLALACAAGASLAWAEPDGEGDPFEEVSDVAGPGDGDDAARETDAVSRVAVTSQSDEANGAAAEGDPAGESEEDSAEGGETSEAPAWAFAKDERTVEVGETVLVGFAPSEGDAKSDDRQRAKWYGDWKVSVQNSSVDMSAQSGWLVAEADGEKLDYDGIVGITTSDEETFELFGEFPEWKVGEDGVEYRWWYGLLGKAKKAGDVKLSIMRSASDGSIEAVGECTVHVVEPAKTAAAAPSKSRAAEQPGSSSSAAISAQAADESASAGSESASAVSVSTQSEQSASSSGLTSKSATNGASGLTSKSASAASAQSADAAYPKAVATTASGSKHSASLLANDAASEAALAKLAGTGELSLLVDSPAKLGDAAETSISALAKTGNLQIAERLSVTVVDERGKEVPVSGMNLTVRVAADDAVKALDASSVQVWYAAQDGATEKKDAKIADGQLSITTDHLSDFVVLGTKASTAGSGAASTGTSGLSSNSSSKNLPQTGDSMVYLAVALAFVAGFSASSALNARRRIKEAPFDFGRPAA